MANIRAETKTWLGGDGYYATPELWSGSAVPAAGDEAVISNGAVTVTAADTFADLASIALGTNGAITSAEAVETDAAVTFSSGSTLRPTAGELVFHGFASGAGFTKEGAGVVRFTGSNSTFTAFAPGLREGRLSGYFNLSSLNAGSRISAALEMANTTWPSDLTATTFAYSGEIYLDGSAYSFAENVDDAAYLNIAGATVLSNVVSNVASSNTLQLAAGWYPIELRVGNNLGAGGSANVFSTGGGVAWKKAHLPWQVLRDFSGAFLRSPGKLATAFSQGMTLSTGTVVISAGTAAAAVNSGTVNALGELTLSAGTLVLSNSVYRATALNGTATALLRLDTAQLTLTNEADCVYPGKTAGQGTFVKDGVGRLQWEARANTHYAHSATVVNNGAIALGSSATWLGDYTFGSFTVNAPATLETLVNGNSQFSNLWGDGTLTNRGSTGGPFQLRITQGPSEFAGQIHGYIRYYSQGAFALTGTNSTFSGNFAIHSSGGPGVTGAKKIGMKGLPSSVGTYATIDIRENGGTLQYLGAGETTDKNFSLYPSANRAVIDGGFSGGVTFSGSLSTSGGRLVRLAVTGANVAPCVFTGAYSEHSQNSTNYSTYLAKEGPGIWIFKNNASRSNRGVVDVRDGTLQFESIAEAGVICSLGRSDLLFADVINSNTNGFGVPYAFSLGTATATGTLEYVGTNSGSCSTRKLVLQGNGRLKSDSAPLTFSSGVQSLTAGAKTLYLAGSATNVLGAVADGAGAVGIAKEGSGTWKLSATNAFSGPLEVKSGQLVLDKRGYAYYRFTMLQRNYNILPTADTNIELTEFALYSADGVRRNLNLVKNGTNNVSGLNPGEFCPMGAYPTYATRNDINLFDGNVNSQWTTDTSPFLPNTPMALVMRVAEGTPAIASYDLQYWSSTTNRFLSGWSLEGSRDATAWDKLHAVTNFIPVAPATVGGGVKWWYSTGTATPSNGFSIADGQLTDPQLQAGVQVSVAAGAVLALLGGSEPLGALSVDCDAGGGTISDLLLAQTGRLDLTGTSIQGHHFAVPLTIGHFINPELLKDWDLFINGQLIQGAVLRWDATTETLWVVPLGTLIRVN